ncbi:hypothetical protein Vadar_002602 [Vaccinium darrowii]|uniref:Uncharacterized protein n=1 Tax=Vaccinium darrowii TaxID=229202 RepID=A0ACB7XEY0_9ERIC|nr:hypothetical protein Vadar_002602 [Vaccinium darrowii]
MCQQPASPILGRCDPVEDPESDVLSHLVFKSPTSPQQQNEAQCPEKTDHFHLFIKEAHSIAKISFPMVLTGLLIYSRNIISTLFLGGIEDKLALAGGALAMAFGNITGYSILSGLAMGMEPVCGQAFGAQKLTLLGISLQRTILLLICTSFPIAFLWLNMRRLLLFCGQEEDIAKQAQLYLICSIPDLLAQSFLHPLRIYLRTQSINLPLTLCATLTTILHIPINSFLVYHLKLGIKGVALGGVLFNFNLVAFLIIYIVFSGIYKKTWGGLSMECIRGWKPLLSLAIPSCISVCLEWWWYEIMILLSGLLANPNAAVASMGILIQSTALIYVFPTSLSFSVSTRVGNELGAGEPKKAKWAATVGLCFSFMLGFSALVFAFSVRKMWATMFTKDSEIIALTSLVLPVIGLCELGNCPQTTGCGVLRGTARPKVGANINLCCFYLVGMPVAVGLGFWARLDFLGLWLGLLAAQGSCAVTMMVVLGRTDWAVQAERAKELTSAGGVIDGREENEDNKPLIALEGVVKENCCSCLCGNCV